VFRAVIGTGVAAPRLEVGPLSARTKTFVLHASVEHARSTMQSAQTLDEAPEAAALRGRMFTELDRLAFAIEMEAADHLRQGRDEEAARATAVRLGVRLAQRLVSGAWADEVGRRMERWSAEYDSRLGLSPGVEEAVGS